jgi:hypothetical protein
MLNRLWILILVVTVSSFGCVGCGEPTKAGMVVGNARAADVLPTPRADSTDFAADVPIRDPSGKVTTIRESVDLIYVVSFVDPEGINCCGIDHRLAELADRLHKNYVSVVQISEPTGVCPLDADSVRTCPVPPANLYRFFDPNLLAWEAYGRPEPGTLFLVDANRRIDMVGTLDDVDTLVDRANELAWEINDSETGAMR